MDVAIYDANGCSISVGDEVRVIRGLDGNDFTGLVGVVVAVDFGYPICVDFSSCGLSEAELSRKGCHGCDGRFSRRVGRYGYGYEVEVVTINAIVPAEIKVPFETMI